ncbi:MAG TPA: VIT1/CCC1 transporter family protein [Patescibacteria group bacterium]|nr:VIT1/CCC1 transporter family protein [Patescibacteria group bacterium]
MKRARKKIAYVVEEVIFGVEDSLVSTVGVLTGVAAGTQSSYVVVLSGIVLIFAEGLSMAAGSYLSSKAEGQVWMKQHEDDWHSLMKRDEKKGPIETAVKKIDISPEDEFMLWKAINSQRKRWLQQVMRHTRNASIGHNKRPILAGTVMGISYLSAGIIPLAAYLFLPVEQAVWPSIIVTMVALFIFGSWSATITGRTKWKAGVEMLVVAGAATGIAYALGLGARSLFGIVV